MDKYFDYATTPLKYHNFLRFFSMPLGLLITVVQLFNLVPEYNASYGVVRMAYGVDLFFVVLSAIVMGLTLYGLYTWKPCGFYGILAHHGLNVLSAVVYIVLFSMFELSEQAGSMVSNLIGNLVVSLLVCIYYLKRRPLFFENMRLEFYKNLQAMPVEVKPVDRSGGDSTRCRVCGEKINTGRISCMKCGASIPRIPTAPDGDVTAADKPNFCFQCGGQLERGSKFCSHCGVKQN